MWLADTAEWNHCAAIYRGSFGYVVAPTGSDRGSGADWIYFYALTFPGSMISIVSMVRRSNVLVTFLAGALFFHEKNLKSKAIDLFLVLLGMIFLYLGTR